MYVPNNLGIAFSLTMLAGLTTAIGGAIAFITKKDNLKVLSLGLGFSAGVMIFISLVDIIPEANNMLRDHFSNNYQWLVFGGFLLGLLISVAIDYFLPDHVDANELLDPDAPEENNHYKHYKLKRAGMLTAIAICIHNFPEGIANFMISSESLRIGIPMVIAIAIHNIPEGIAVALPLYHATGKKRVAIGYSFLSGMSEPFGAVIAFILMQTFLPNVFLF